MPPCAPRRACADRRRRRAAARRGGQQRVDHGVHRRSTRPGRRLAAAALRPVLAPADRRWRRPPGDSAPQQRHTAPAPTPSVAPWPDAQSGAAQYRLGPAPPRGSGSWRKRTASCTPGSRTRTPSLMAGAKARSTAPSCVAVATCSMRSSSHREPVGNCRSKSVCTPGALSGLNRCEPEHSCAHNASSAGQGVAAIVDWTVRNEARRTRLRRHHVCILAAAPTARPGAPRGALAQRHMSSSESSSKRNDGARGC